MTDFTSKNARRRRCHQDDPELYRTGRANRKAWARNGCFGRTKVATYVRCVVGTTGVAPSAKAEEAEAA